MDGEVLLNNTDSLLFQCALQTRELVQRKNEINEEIKVCRAELAERKSHIEKMRENIKSLEEDIRVKQRTVTHNKANAKSMKTTHNLLHQYEQTLKAELERRKASYNHDMEVYEERIASYRQRFQSDKEYYFRNPLGQKLLMLQAENEEIAHRIKACDDQITIKQEELDNLTGPAVSSSSPVKPSDSVSGQQPVTEPETLPDHRTEEDNEPAFDISSLHLNQTKVHHNTSVEVNAEEICEIQNALANTDLWSYQQVDEQSQPAEMHTEEDQDATPQDQALLQQFTELNSEQAVEEEMEGGVVLEEEQTTDKEANKSLTTAPQPSSEETSHQSSLGRMKAGPPTPTFPFNFSPGSSPHQGTSDTKSPAFLFSLNSAPSTPGFFGFGLDVGSQDEDSAVPFSSSLFSDKKNTETKSTFEFLFDQPEQNEDFQFSFPSKSPAKNPSEKEKTGDDFVFSFNF